MTVRRGMADYRQAGAGGIIFMGLLQAQGQEMTYEQRRILYRSLYSAVVAKIDMDDKTKKEQRISYLVKDTQKLLKQAGEDYQAPFEQKTYGEIENAYSELLAQILDALWEMAIRAKLIESITMEQEPIER